MIKNKNPQNLIISAHLEHVLTQLESVLIFDKEALQPCAGKDIEIKKDFPLSIH